MEKFTVGDIVLVAFPFSDLSGQKLRPACVLAKVEFDNLILCQITSKPYTSKQAIRVQQSDFSHGGLPVISYIRPDKLFTAEPSLIRRTVGTITPKIKTRILAAVRSIF